MYDPTVNEVFCWGYAHPKAPAKRAGCSKSRHVHNNPTTLRRNVRAPSEPNVVIASTPARLNRGRRIYANYGELETLQIAFTFKKVDLRAHMACRLTVRVYPVTSSKLITTILIP